MPLHLSASDAALLGAACSELLSPLAGGDPDGWWRRVEARTHELFGGANVLLTWAEPARYEHTSATIDAAAMRRMGELVRADPRSARIVIDDEVAPRFDRLRRARGLDAWDQRVAARLLEAHGMHIRQSVWCQDAVLPAGLHDFGVMVDSQPGGELYVCVGHRRPGHPRSGDVLPLLELLLPALRAGHHALLAHAGRRAALAETLDAVSDALLVVGPDGRELHRNAALRRALAHEPAREAVLRAAAALAAELRALRRRGVHAAGGVPAPRTVATALGRYALHGVFAPAALWGVADAVQVSVEVAAGALAAPPAAATSLAAAHGLTAREAEVAALLARRLRNDEVAAALGVSAHTARRHTERVLQKLGVAKRVEVAAALLSDGRPPAQ